MVLVQILRRNAIVAASLLALAGSARAADDGVADRLTDHGGLSASAAKKLVSKVNVRMAKAADALASATDPMRAAVSLALFQTPHPPNSMAAAKVRLRLYAGLNEWALEAIFAPQPGIVAGCVREIGATTSECEALVAAAARSSVAEIRNVAGGSGTAFAGAPPPPAAASGSRFGRFNSGYQAAPQGGSRFPAYRAPQAQAYGHRAAAPQRSAPARFQPAAPPQVAPAQRYQRPQAAPAFTRPAPAYAAPARPAASEAQLESRKEAYKARRQAYLERQREMFERRRDRIASVHKADAANAPPRDGEGVPAGASIREAPANQAPSKAAKVEEAPSAGGGEVAESVASSGSDKPALDSDFLDGLLEDPLANKKK